MLILGAHKVRCGVCGWNLMPELWIPRGLGCRTCAVGTSVGVEESAAGVGIGGLVGSWT